MITLIPFLINSIAQKDTLEGLGIQFGSVGFWNVNITDTTKGLGRKEKQLRIGRQHSKRRIVGEDLGGHLVHEIYRSLNGFSPKSPRHIHGKHEGTNNL